MIYVDFAFYAGNYFGSSIAEADFKRLARDASLVIDQLTYDRAEPIVTLGTDTDTIDKIQKATCAVADELAAIEASGGILQGERVGNVSVTYQNPLSKSARVTNAAKSHLWSTGLMYRGFTSDER